MRKCIEEAARANRFPSLRFEVQEPPKPQFGDLSSNIAFLLSSKTKEDPMSIAEKISRKISLSGKNLILKFEPVKPGYINFWANLQELFFQTLSKAISEQDYGKINLGRGRRVAIEHTSVNPNKALHYGHLRNVVLGDSVRKILSFMGHDVQVLNYIDDSGAQVADVVVGFKYAGFPLEPSTGEKYDHYCGDTVYVKVNELYESRPDLREKQREVLKALEDPDSKLASFARRLTRRIVREQLRTCWRVGARYDCLNFETQIIATSLWKGVFRKIKEKRIATRETSGKYTGCWIVRVRGEDEGEEKVLVRSDGTATYVAKDIPYAAWKLGLIPDKFGYEKFAQQPDGTILWAAGQGSSRTHPRFGKADLAITVTDTKQKRLQRIVSYVLGRLAGVEASRNYVHLAYEPVSLSAETARTLGIEVGEEDFLHMAGRKGIYVNADKVLDMLYKKAFDETRGRNPAESNSWLEQTSEKVAISAVRFELLRQDLDKMITFDMSESLRLEGETGPYIQYAHARASRILEKSGVHPSVTRKSISRLTDQVELELGKRISKFDLVIEEAAANLSPKVLARFLYTLSANFNSFYEKKPVIQEVDENVRLARLALVKGFENTCRVGLSLLGIEAPGRI